MKKLRILIADDHGMIRQGVRAVIASRRDWELVGEAVNGRDAVNQARKLSPDLVVIDLTMPELNGLDAIREIRSVAPRAAVLVLTMHDSDSLARQVLAAGARGYLLKSDAPEWLTQAVDALAAGRTYFTPKVSDLLVGGLAQGKRPSDTVAASRLTPRERQLVQLLAEGRSNKEAATAMNISLSTVETHRRNVMSKLDLRMTSDLVRYAIREKLIEP